MLCPSVSLLAACHCHLALTSACGPLPYNLATQNRTRFRSAWDAPRGRAAGSWLVHRATLAPAQGFTAVCNPAVGMPRSRPSECRRVQHHACKHLGLGGLVSNLDGCGRRAAGQRDTKCAAQCDKKCAAGSQVGQHDVLSTAGKQAGKDSQRQAASSSRRVLSEGWPRKGAVEQSLIRAPMCGMPAFHALQVITSSSSLSHTRPNSSKTYSKTSSQQHLHQRCLPRAPPPPLRAALPRSAAAPPPRQRSVGQWAAARGALVSCESDLLTMSSTRVPQQLAAPPEAGRRVLNSLQSRRPAVHNQAQQGQH